MAMHLLSVNTGQATPIHIGNKVDQTGIYKTPVREAVLVDTLGLLGDVQVDKEHHGGVDQAVYIYSQEDYAYWSAELGYELKPGTFGENLTLSAFPKKLYIGDRFGIGDVILEITSPRIPCSTLASRMNDLGFVKTFAKAERPGVYTRVLQKGKVQAGEAVSFTRGNSDVTILDYFRFVYAKQPSNAQLETLLAAPIDERGRAHYQEVLAKQTA